MISSTLVQESAPDLVRLTEFAILGGVAGKPVSICFRDFPSDVITALWGHLAKSVGPEYVAEVWSQSDIRRMLTRLQDLRIVLVYPGSRFQAGNIVEWLVEQRRDGTKELPAVLSVHSSGTMGTSGATLVANGSQELVRQLTRWLLTSKQASERGLLVNNQGNEVRPRVSCNRLIAAIQKSRSMEEDFSLRDIRIIEGLAAGISFDRYLRSGSSIEPITEATPEDYEALRSLMGSGFLQNVEVPVDDLTKQMIDRANLYLEMQSNCVSAPPLAFGARRGAASTLNRQSDVVPQRELSRNELADLGNAHSNILKNLVRCIAAKNEKALLLRLGLKNSEKVIDGGHPQQRIEQLMGFLVTWSYKQVRTRFERLRNDGFIEVRRKQLNGPSVYTLPTEMILHRSHFLALPALIAVTAAYAEGAQ